MLNKILSIDMSSFLIVLVPFMMFAVFFLFLLLREDKGELTPSQTAIAYRFTALFLIIGIAQIAFILWMTWPALLSMFDVAKGG